MGIPVDTLPVGLAGCCASGAVTVRETFAWFDIFFGRSRVYLVLCREVELRADCLRRGRSYVCCV